MPPLVLFAGGQGERLLSTGLRWAGAGACGGVWGGGVTFELQDSGDLFSGVANAN